MGELRDYIPADASYSSYPEFSTWRCFRVQWSLRYDERLEREEEEEEEGEEELEPKSNIHLEKARRYEEPLFTLRAQQVVPARRRSALWEAFFFPGESVVIGLYVAPIRVKY